MNKNLIGEFDAAVHAMARSARDDDFTRRLDSRRVFPRRIPSWSMSTLRDLGMSNEKIADYFQTWGA